MHIDDEEIANISEFIKHSEVLKWQSYISKFLRKGYLHTLPFSSHKHKHKH